MVGLGTLVNTAAVIAGGGAGILIKNGISERFKEIIMQAIGLAVLIIGMSGALQGIYKITAGGELDRQHIMVLIFSLVIGAVIGEAINIEKRLENFGNKLQNRFADKGSSFTTGFVTSSLIYCVGAMAIVGSLEDGLSGNTDTLFAKSILDGVSAVIFAATMGSGVIFSALPVFIYQGSITLLANFVKPWLTTLIITQTSMVGGVLIMAIGMNILGISKVKIGNLLPALFVPLLFSWLHISL